VSNAEHAVFTLLQTEKAAPGGLFLFLLYKFRISYRENKPAKILLVLSGMLSSKVTLGKWWKLDKKPGNRE
jgi:hypothetical protein